LEVNKDIRIINSYGEYLKNGKYISFYENHRPKYNIEEEIKKCEIKINDKLIPLNYFYKFKSKGKYVFKNNIKNLCLIFAECKYIRNIILIYLILILIMLI